MLEDANLDNTLKLISNMHQLSSIEWATRGEWAISFRYDQSSYGQGNNAYDLY
jgi:hypothetical protein